MNWNILLANCPSNANDLDNQKILIKPKNRETYNDDYDDDHDGNNGDEGKVLNQKILIKPKKRETYDDDHDGDNGDQGEVLFENMSEYM